MAWIKVIPEEEAEGKLKEVSDYITQRAEKIAKERKVAMPPDRWRVCQSR